ncbi:MAG: hypothetical protein BTN85_0401 [Candidatus Methanohalarchaeum thermophilum]|uniref:Uncharacterized protein n=1 Tax=Methanohalarchaeum thermophilum TaxID=1903181 RepID=A0A1Q6DU83_METT1|nr:MAG: hypothetical protein BTN85_0401 [Candidatus Methanohalarchaeum thermophilum]
MKKIICGNETEEDFQNQKIREGLKLQKRGKISMKPYKNKKIWEWFFGRSKV